mmetsp:Transcript_26327/g.62555  ORF Transcript_26327/g.62555 Transcript_26327/m.62555 type:complete len:316 (+) Transcript_26327:28-975(+)
MNSFSHFRPYHPLCLFKAHAQLLYLPPSTRTHKNRAKKQQIVRMAGEVSAQSNSAQALDGSYQETEIRERVRKAELASCGLLRDTVSSSPGGSQSLQPDAMNQPPGPGHRGLRPPRCSTCSARNHTEKAIRASPQGSACRLQGYQIPPVRAQARPPSESSGDLRDSSSKPSQGGSLWRPQSGASQLGPTTPSMAAPRLARAAPSPARPERLLRAEPPSQAVSRRSRHQSRAPRSACRVSEGAPRAPQAPGTGCGQKGCRRGRIRTAPSASGSACSRRRWSPPRRAPAEPRARGARTGPRDPHGASAGAARSSPCR